MAALTADKIVHTKGSLRRGSYKVKAATIIYCGALVCLDANGWAIPASDTAGITDVVGVATAKADNAAGGNGDILVTVEFGGDFLIDVGAGITQDDVGRSAYVVDDQTATDVAAATNDIYIGPIRKYVAGTTNKAWIGVVGAR
jgi:hypothetical protein